MNVFSQKISVFIIISGLLDTPLKLDNYGKKSYDFAGDLIAGECPCEDSFKGCHEG